MNRRDLFKRLAGAIVAGPALKLVGEEDFVRGIVRRGTIPVPINYPEMPWLCSGGLAVHSSSLLYILEDDDAS
jgi:hypothetical protein